MVLESSKKSDIISKFGRTKEDTGSAEVQVAMLSERIDLLSKHLQNNGHDFSSRQGLLKMIGQRKRLLNYVRQKSISRYDKLVKKLGIRG